MLPDPAAPSVVVPDVDTAGPDLAATGDVYLDAARRYCADTTPLDEHVTCTAEDPLFRDAIDFAFAAGRVAADTELAEARTELAKWAEGETVTQYGRAHLAYTIGSLNRRAGDTQQRQVWYGPVEPIDETEDK